MKQEKNKNSLYTELSGNFNEYYKELNILGEGTVGLVKKCRDLITKKIYAVKIIKTRNEEIIENIKKEFKNLKKIIHKNIIEVKKLLIDNLTGKIYLVMEYFEGDEMFEYISNSGSYSEQKAKYLFKQLLEGIHFLHKKGIVHRDLKPNNILVSTNGKVLKITDFNVAKFCDDYQNYDDFKKNNYEMNTYTGTIAFRAPEMFEKLSYSESIDIWAAGCVLYTMLCGEQPFFSQYITDLIILIEKCDYNFENKGWDLVSQKAKNLITNLIVKDPKKRLAPKIALKNEWFFEEEKNKKKNNCLETRNQIQSNLKKNKRRLTKTNIFKGDKRNSFNQGLRMSKGFDIFIKRMDERDFGDNSCSDYNINDSYESLDSGFEGEVIREENNELDFGEIRKWGLKDGRKVDKSFEDLRRGDEKLGIGVDNKIDIDFEDLRKNDANKNKKVNIDSGNLRNKNNINDSKNNNLIFEDLKKINKKNLINVKKNALDDLKNKNYDNILKINKKDTKDEKNLQKIDKKESKKNCIDKNFIDIKKEVKMNEQEINDFINFQKKNIKIEDIKKIKK